jgi:formiminoglutamase
MVPRADDVFLRPDDPKLGELIEHWSGNADALTAGRPVLIGFPHDEGVRRNHGRPGAADAPNAIRHWLRRLAPGDPFGKTGRFDPPPLDLGNVRYQGSLEATQAALGEIVAAVLQSGAIPIVIGGGHETAYGHYLGYVNANLPVAVINLDAHLDVRPLIDGRGHSGSPFRQMMEHPTHPLPGHRYVCIGLQEQNLAREHWLYVQEKECELVWAHQLGRHELASWFEAFHMNLPTDVRRIYLSLDADVVCAGDVPGVSAPNVNGLPGAEVLGWIKMMGKLEAVASFEVVEINPRHDRDDQSSRWAALAVWNFLVGLSRRSE